MVRPDVGGNNVVLLFFLTFREGTTRIITVIISFSHWIFGDPL